MTSISLSLARGLAGVGRSPTARREAGLAFALVAVGAAFSLASPYFLTTNNLVTVLRNAVELSVVTAGMTLVIIMGGIDVGVGGIVAVAAIAVGRAYQAGLPEPAVIVIGLTVGLLLGLVNGLLCSRVRVPPIVATLGTMYIWLATVFLVLGGSWLAGLPSTLTPLVRGSLLGIPSAVLVIGGVYLVCWYVLRWTPFGRHLYAIGCSEAAARLSGIAVDRVKLRAYGLLGLLAGFAAILYVARLRNVEINIGTTVALEAIAATILGGTSIRGGVGSLPGALLGVLFIKIVQNGLILVGVSSLWEPVVIGGLLIAVLALDARQHGGWRGMLG
jgi:ribose transport system permease protein/AI-2 transport system permease protein